MAIDALVIIYVGLALLLFWFSFRSYRDGVAYLRFFTEKIPGKPSITNLSATVICPCRGDEPGLADNLACLIQQSHANYELIFAVDDAADPAVAVISDIVERSNGRARLVVAEKADRCSQKIANLIDAVRESSETDVLVFVDSDARPSREWLAYLIAPLHDGSVGAATGYRWFVADESDLATELRAAWNASIATALGPNTANNFCWGGSMAIRRDTFELLNIADAWSRGLSDDLLVTRAMKTAKMPIVFVPQALTASFGNCTFPQLIEFTNRQMKITRVYAPKLWAMSFAGSGLFLAVVIASIIVALFGGDASLRIFAVAILAGILGLSLAKSIVRLDAVKLALPQHTETLDVQARWLHILFLLAPALFFYNSIAALVSRKIEWRGIRYEMRSHDETVKIDQPCED